MPVHVTPTTGEEAAAEQLRLRARTVLDSSGPPPGGPGTVVAGVDVAYDDDRGVVAAAAVLLDAATLAVTETATATGPVPFPYLPGLLAFRELPAVLDALGALRRTPDLIVCDGYGIAHPRRFGLASHLGVLTGLPTIGVAKTPFLFTYEPPGPRRGDRSPLRDGDEVVGSALRTRDGVKPVFVSPGHRTTVEDACAHTLHLTTRGFRLPETTRAADHACRAALRAA